MPLVSIIVPVYKVEAYLRRCIHSLRNQTLQDIEIILVDDGSPDNCPLICDELEKEDLRIRVIHKKNGGLSSARNAGLRIATGKYIGFVDSDDDVDETMYESMVDKLITENVDFVMADYIRIKRDGTHQMVTKNLDGGHYYKADIERLIFPQLIMGENLNYGPLLSVWHCLYKKSFLEKNNLYFDEEVFWSEDNIFSALVGYYAESFYYMKGVQLYHYYDNPGTITTGYRRGAWIVYSRMNEHLHSFFDYVKEYDFSSQLKLHAIYYACNSLRQVPLSGESKEKQEELTRGIMCSQTLISSFHNFQFPQSWTWKLKLQVWVIKRRWVKLYMMWCKYV